MIELSGETSLKGTPQMLPPADGRPERLYLDLEGVWVGTRYLAGVPVGDGLLRGVRIGQNTARAVRVVLDLQNYARHRVLLLTHPDRLVIDVYGSRTSGARARAAPASPGRRAHPSRRACPPTCAFRRRSCSTPVTAAAIPARSAWAGCARRT